MDPQRNFAGDGEQHWFEGGEWNRGRHGAPADGNGTYHAAEEEYTGEVRGPSPSEPVSGPAEAQRRQAESIDVGAMRRPPVSSPPAGYPPPAYGGGQEQPMYPSQSGPPDPSGGMGAPTTAVPTIPPPRQQPSVYQSRKPVVLVALVVLTVLFEIPALRLLASATVADAVPAGGVVAGTFMVLGLPVFAYGLYGMLGGGPVATNLAGWLRQPLIYVPLGVLLFLFAALAA